MRRILLIPFMLTVFISTKCQILQPTYLGEAKWSLAPNQMAPKQLKVTENKYLMTEIVTQNKTNKVFENKLDPKYILLHKGPTNPVVEQIDFIAKKMSAPEIIDAPPLQTRDNATFNISYTDKKHGFPGNHTTSFAEDKDHQMWIAADNGLYRYDGYHYYLYSPKNGVPSMPNLSLQYDSEQRLWLASDSGVYYIKHDSIFTLKSKEIDFTNVPCFNVQMDHLKRIWLSTKKNGAICIDKNAISIYDKRCGLTTDYVSATLYTKNGDIYLGLRDLGMIVIQKDNMYSLFSTSPTMKWHSILSFFEEEDGIWAGGFLSGLLHLGKKDTTQYSFNEKYNERIFDIKKAPGGLWIAGYSSSLYYFNKSTFTAINETNGLINRFPYTLFKDSFNNLWVSNLESGFSRVNENNFYIQPFENLAIGNVRNILPDNKNGKWIITEGKGVIYQKDKTNISYTYKDKAGSEPFLYPHDGKLDDDGSLWTGSYGPGIVHSTGKVNTTYTYSDFPDHSILRSVEKGTNNTIWFCPTDFGLIRYNHTKFIHYTQASGLLSNTVMKLFHDSHKNIYWTFKIGLQRIIEEKIETLTIGNQIFSDQINELLAIDKHITLLGSANMGLVLIKNNHVFRFSKNEGLASNNVKTIIQDGSKRIWITTDKSIESFFLVGDLIKDHTIYNEANGSFIIETQNAFLDTLGIPYWSLADKKLLFNPNFQNPSKTAPIFTIKQLEIDNKIVPSTTNLSVLPNQIIKLNFTSIFWGRENNLGIKYLLISETGDTIINAIGDKGHIAITNIIPGRYQFLLSATDNNKVFYSTPFIIQINNYWYNTWLFRIIMAAILISLIIFYFKWKVYRQKVINNYLKKTVSDQTKEILKEQEELLVSYKVIEDQNNEKEVLIQEINHRVKNNLQFLTAMIDMQLGKDYSEQTIQALLGTSNRIKAMSLVHEMLYYKSDQQILSTHKYINELLSGLMKMADENEIKYTFNIDIVDININARTGISLGMIISELVINSIKYAFDNTEFPVIQVTLSKEAETGNCILIVGDNGKGIDGDYELKKGVGSRLVDIFSRQLKGLYTIEHKNKFLYTLIFKSPTL